MKILFVTPYYKPYLGGIERVIENLSAEFLKSTQVKRVGVLTTRWSFPRRFEANWPQQQIIDEVEIFRLNSRPRTAPPFFQIPLVWFSPHEIRKILDQFQPDVIQLMNDRWFWGNFWVWFWERKKTPLFFSLSFHPLTLWQQPLRPINFFLTRVADKVVVITEHEKKLVKKTYWTPEHKFRVIPWGIAKKFQRQSRKRQKQKGPTTILCVGRLSRHKGQEWLVELVNDISTTTNEKLQLVLIGEDEAEISLKLTNIVKSPLLELEITGPVPETRLNQYYSQADIFVLFPEYEAFGLVFLEALSHQIPVVTHKVGAIEEVLNHAALLIDPYNKTQAQVVLTKLIQDEKFRQELGRKGFEYVRRNYSWEKTARQFLKLYGVPPSG